MYKVAAALLIALISAMPSLGVAAEWDVDMAASRLGFSIDLSGARTNGHFADWVAHVSFDPDRPDLSTVTVEVMTGSIVVEASEAMDVVGEPPWLDSEAMPDAVFRTTSIVWQEGGLVADGTLSLKAVERPLTLSGALTIEGDRASATLTGSIPRDEFGIGPVGGFVGPVVNLDITILATRRMP